MSSLIELRRVSKGFGPHDILRDISVPVARGETLVLIGESGCGKSVTMKLMMDLLRPDEGNVFWDGRNVRDRSDKEITKERLRFGYVFQMAALFDSMTVYENVVFGIRQNRNWPEERVRQVAVDRLRDVGLSANVCEKKPAELSGGMRKRVGLARALAMDPEVVLYDEPTTGLDPIMSDVINELILQTSRNRNVTSIVVTHDMHTVRKVADRVVMLYPLPRLEPDEPQIIFQGTAEETFNSDDPRVYQFVRGEAGERLTEIAAA